MVVLSHVLAYIAAEKPVLRCITQDASYFTIIQYNRDEEYASNCSDHGHFQPSLGLGGSYYVTMH
jgi:hypothetical protein